MDGCRQLITMARRDCNTKLPERMTMQNEASKTIANTLSFVAALIATVTFAAAFTVPGGIYESNVDVYGAEKGTAVLIKHIVFKLVVKPDTGQGEEGGGCVARSGGRGRRAGRGAGSGRGENVRWGAEAGGRADGKRRAGSRGGERRGVEGCVGRKVRTCGKFATGYHLVPHLGRGGSWRKSKFDGFRILGENEEMDLQVPMLDVLVVGGFACVEVQVLDILVRGGFPYTVVRVFEDWLS
eukprot:Gb_35379 [translate_table: standard]